MMNEEILLLIIGAFIGIVPGLLIKIVYDSLLKESKRESVSKAIISELEELKYQYLLTIYNIDSRYELLNREKIRWIYENLKAYKDIEDAENIIKGLKGFSVLNDNQINEFNRIKKSQSEGKSLIPKKSRVLFIEQNMDYIDLFNTDYQYKIIKIMKGIDIALYYDRKTFEVEDEDNHRKICLNVDMSIKGIGRWGVILVNNISEFIEQNEKSNSHVNLNT